MGPNMAAGAAKLEGCKKRGAVGPFPFASGTLEVSERNIANIANTANTANTANLEEDEPLRN